MMSGHRPLLIQVKATRKVSILVAALLAMAMHPTGSAAGPVEPAEVAKALASVVIVLPRWRGVRPGFAPRSAGRRIAPEGSGVVILSDGYVVTNDHVLGDPIDVRVRLDDGREIVAAIIGRHKKTDIALLKVPVDLPVLSPASKNPMIAEPACAIGNPFGRGISVSCGVVSAVNRANAGFNDIEDFIQTDAAVNPGGSGGALVDGRGRMLGMVSAIFAQDSDANLGVNFAASAALVHRVAEDLKTHGKVVEGGIGIEVAPLTTDQATAGAGVAVVRVDRNGPALAAGIEAGDTITSVAGRPISSPAQFRATVFLARPGSEIQITTRRGPEVRSVGITVVPTK